VDLVVALEQLCADHSAEDATGARDEEPHAVSLCRDGVAATALVALLLSGELGNPVALTSIA
jgi:hypothetical protein